MMYWYSFFDRVSYVTFSSIEVTDLQIILVGTLKRLILDFLSSFLVKCNGKLLKIMENYYK